jgi:hypothetical protein
MGEGLEVPIAANENPQETSHNKGFEENNILQRS